MTWFQLGRDGATIQIQAQPGAKRTEVAGLHGDALKVRLASPPVDGKANECLIAFLAERLGVRKSEVVITRGLASRRKTVRVSTPGCRPEALLSG